MKKLLLTLVLLLATAGSVLTLSPTTLLATVQFAERQLAGLSLHSQTVGDLTYSYYDGGPQDAPAIVMIHGFGANKDNWLRFARPLTAQYRVIALDLPGFGDSSKPTSLSYDVASQSERVLALLDALKISKFHVIGNSMGGHISALLAARHPERVLSAALLDNAGVEAPNKSEFFRRIEQGEANPLVVSKPEDFRRLLDFVFVEAPPMPAPLQEHFAAQAMANAAHYQLIFGHLRERYVPLEPELPKITAPVLLLWGDKDRVLDVSSIEVMKPLLQKPSVVVMKNCGHVPMLERPEETAGHYQRFLTQVQ